MSLFTLTLNVFDTTHTFVFDMKAEPGGVKSGPRLNLSRKKTLLHIEHSHLVCLLRTIHAKLISLLVLL